MQKDESIELPSVKKNLSLRVTTPVQKKRQKLSISQYSKRTRVGVLITITLQLSGVEWSFLERTH